LFGAERAAVRPPMESWTLGLSVLKCVAVDVGHDNVGGRAGTDGEGIPMDGNVQDRGRHSRAGEGRTLRVVLSVIA